MKTTKFFIGFAVLSVFSCGSDKKQPSETRLETSLTTQVKPGTPIESIVYGSYCGKCKGRCAVMYQVHLTGNVITLFADTTNAFFRSTDSLDCNVVISDSAMVSAAMQLETAIPKRLLESEKTEQRFGCPDCSDQCGIYLEVRFDDTERHRKKMLLDTHTKGMKNDLVDLVQNLEGLLAKMLY